MAKVFSKTFKLAPGTDAKHRPFYDAVCKALANCENHEDVIVRTFDFIIADAAQPDTRFPKELQYLKPAAKFVGNFPQKQIPDQVIKQFQSPVNRFFDLKPGGELGPLLRILDLKCDAYMAVVPKGKEKLQKIGLPLGLEVRAKIERDVVLELCAKVDLLLAEGIKEKTLADTDAWLNQLYEGTRSKKDRTNPDIQEVLFAKAQYDKFEEHFKTKHVDVLQAWFGFNDRQFVRPNLGRVLDELRRWIPQLPANDLIPKWKDLLTLVRTGDLAVLEARDAGGKPPVKDKVKAAKALYDTLNEKFGDAVNAKSTIDSKKQISIESVVNSYAKALRRQYGISTLKDAKNEVFDKTTTINELVSQLLEHTWQVLSGLPLQFTDVNPAGDALASLRLFVPPQWPFRIGAHAPDAFDVPAIMEKTVKSANRPFFFLGILGDETGCLFLFGGGDGFYVEDGNYSDRAYTITANNIDLTKTVYFSDRKVKADGVPEKDKEKWKTLVKKTLEIDKFDLKAIWLPVYRASDTGILTLLIRLVAGGGHGIGRADPVPPTDYLWSLPKVGNANQVKLIELLGLDLKRRIENPPKPVEYPLLSFVGDTPFSVQVLELEDTQAAKFKGEYWIVVNLPHPRFLSTEAPRPGKHALDISDLRKDIWELFNIRYYRRANENLLVLKDSKTARNRPLTVEPDSKDMIVNPPIDLASDRNYKVFQTYKSKEFVLKNKRSLAKASNALRENAGTVMAPYGPKLLKDYQPSALSANVFAKLVFEKAPKVLQQWQALKNDTGQIALPTDQEWCHLKGHGDEGKEVIGNFVGGSYHCNTEQLAIEIGHRFVTHKKSAAGYSLNITAYLFENEAVEAPSPLPPGYVDQAYGTKAETPKAKAELKRAAAAAPLAAFVRYKISQKGAVASVPAGSGAAPAGGSGAVPAGGSGSGPAQPEVKANPAGDTDVKIFDHVFEAQSEFFDRNMFTIVSELVRALLDPGTFFERLNEKDAE